MLLEAVMDKCPEGCSRKEHFPGRESCHSEALAEGTSHLELGCLSASDLHHDALMFVNGTFDLEAMSFGSWQCSLVVRFTHAFF